jgi:hypothetical protein
MEYIALSWQANTTSAWLPSRSYPLLGAMQPISFSKNLMRGMHQFYKKRNIVEI